eukprot:TRINITY_DN74_c0_g1_i2.p1 TRINITY_DN74_c0_g1~~TRINITY_DN74_c0_g1_i2.p1  ORF type:complete len:184 (-),score=25.64 TRINITY_DN74_c0_g1_i2:183-734(-)
MTDSMKKAKNFVSDNVVDLEKDTRVKVEWDIHLCSSPCNEPLYWIVGCILGPCTAFYHRYTVLESDLANRYMCCQGNYGKCWCPNQTRQCPTLCLALEALCLTGMCVSGTRHEIMKVAPVKDRPIEFAIIITVAIMSFFLAAMQPIAAPFNACLMSQQFHEVNKRGYRNEKMTNETEMKTTSS